jgi:putative ABC transport system permease protein
MFRNYLISSLRYFKRNRQYTVINVTGLSIGIAASLMLLYVVRHELAYDRFHPDFDRIYRIAQIMSNGEFKITFTQMPHGQALASEHGDVVETVVRVQVRSDRLLSVGDRQFYGETVAYADPNVFDVFGYRLVQGYSKNALQGKESIVLSQSLAKKYFGSADPIGRAIRLDHQNDFVVTGVMEDLPTTTHLKFDCLVNIGRLPNVWRRTNDTWTYVKAKPGVDPSVIEERSKQIYKKYLSDDAATHTSFPIQPIVDIHLHSHLTGEPEINSDSAIVVTLAMIAALILLMGCVNYVNLATAQAMRRFREVGVRKILGAGRFQLARQFFGESLTVVLISTILAVLLVELSLPMLGSFIGKDLSNVAHAPFGTAVILTGVFTIVGILSGVYPTVFLAGQSPVQVLKGEIQKRSGLGFRKILLLGQFAITIVLIIGTWIAFDQLRYLQNKPLGFDKEHLVNVTVRDVERWRDRTETVRTELMSVPGVVNAAIAQFFVTELNVEGSSLKPATAPDDGYRIISFLKCDPYFMPTLDLNVIAGRTFSYRHASDSTGNIILNESASRLFGWTPEQAIGQRMTYNGWHEGEVVGVTPDFHFTSLQTEIAPLALMCWPARATRYASRLSFTVRIRGGNITGTLDGIRQRLASLSPEFPFEYEFVDQSLARHFVQDRINGALFGVFAVLAIVIACLGLFGLTAFTVQQRTKEIGIRKVLGASLGRLLVSLSSDFFVIVVIATLIGWPVAYLWMQQWLGQFAYRTGIDWPVFPLAFVIVSVIAAATISMHALRAARTNPVDALKYE